MSISNATTRVAKQKIKKVKKMKYKKLLFAMLSVGIGIFGAGCTNGKFFSESSQVSVCTVRHMSETLQKDIDNPLSEDIVEAFSGRGDTVCAPFCDYINSFDEMMESDDKGYQYDVMNVLKIIRRPTAWAMRKVEDEDLMRKKAFAWVLAGLKHYNAGVRDRALAVLEILPRGEVESIVAAARKDGVSLLQDIGTCKVCEKGKVTKVVDLGKCPACNGHVVRAEKYKAIIPEKLCKMCGGNGCRSGKLTFVCEHCQGNWNECPILSR